MLMTPIVRPISEHNLYSSDVDWAEYDIDRTMYTTVIIVIKVPLKFRRHLVIFP